MDENKVINLQEIKAKAAGVDPEVAEVIRQLNERFGINIDICDERLERFKHIYPALNEAAQQTHGYDLQSDDPSITAAFNRGVEVGKAQMMTDVIVCLLEQDGLIERA
ncbi:hypothetical protein [Reinekea marinisedimentorum]|uniref:Uncharacterized protein n=1 Tax=Reinekea marinisedimentorum TaxID=230495 RepID=A0A4R3IBS1_9GAMM|nr:hypothetical protein [Reinekea marinisedimentorum]TCS43093.1 hypothetical protein BCF53_102116 [Reinekea marinisedimentorum]